MNFLTNALHHWKTTIFGAGAAICLYLSSAPGVGHGEAFKAAAAFLMALGGAAAQDGKPTA